MAIRTFQYRLYPTKAQKNTLQLQLDVSRHVYLKVSGVGRLKVRWHRPYQGEIKTCRMIRKAGRWYVSLMCEVPDPVPPPETGRVVGIECSKTGRTCP